MQGRPETRCGLVSQVSADLDVLSVVGMHKLDATNSLLLALVGIGHKGAGLGFRV